MTKRLALWGIDRQALPPVSDCHCGSRHVTLIVQIWDETWALSCSICRRMSSPDPVPSFAIMQWNHEVQVFRAIQDLGFVKIRQHNSGSDIPTFYIQRRLMEEIQGMHWTGSDVNALFYNLNRKLRRARGKHTVGHRFDLDNGIVGVLLPHKTCLIHLKARK